MNERAPSYPITAKLVVSMLVFAASVAYFGYDRYRAWTDPMLADKPRLRPESSAELAKLTTARVVMFGTGYCPYCAQARALFDRDGIAYVEFDLDRGGNEARFARDHLKLRVTPTIVIGNRLLVGYSEAGILAALKEQ